MRLDLKAQFTNVACSFGTRRWSMVACPTIRIERTSRSLFYRVRHAGKFINDTVYKTWDDAARAAIEYHAPPSN